MGTSDSEDIHASTKDWINQFCKRLRPSDIDWENASHPTQKYNCMGFAMGPVNGKLRWWEPRIVNDGVWMNDTDYWPNGVPNEYDISAFVKAAEAVGFSAKQLHEDVTGYDIVVLYYCQNEKAEWRHAALCLSEQTWKSKIADHSDIEHSPDAFDDIAYWMPPGRIFLKRVRPVA